VAFGSEGDITLLSDVDGCRYPVTDQVRGGQGGFITCTLAKSDR
jgi:hypothetical protein